MINQQDVHVLILEKDAAVVDLVKDILGGGSYNLHVLSSFSEAVSLLKSENFEVAVVGTTLETHSPFEGLVDLVKASPLTSIILLSDLPDAEVHEKAEGCGILGHIPRSVPSEDLNHLLYRFKQITGLL